MASGLGLTVLRRGKDFAEFLRGGVDRNPIRDPGSGIFMTRLSGSGLEKQIFEVKASVWVLPSRMRRGGDFAQFLRGGVERDDRDESVRRVEVVHLLGSLGFGV